MISLLRLCRRAPRSGPTACVSGANMFMLRLKAIGSAFAELARNAGNVIWAGVKFIAAKLLALCRSVWETFVWALRGVFIPKVASPLEVLKHYLAVLSMALGVMALFWAGR